MKITLKKLILDNFRNISEAFEFNDGRNVFSGPNGAGKTTLFDAISWLLKGKNSQDKADFEIKTIKAGQRMKKANHSVEAIYDIDGNGYIKFGRVFKDKMVKKRGSAEKTKDGNETAYFVDGLEISKTKFNAKVSETFGPHFWACSDIKHVVDLHWKERRELITPMIDSVDNDSIVDSIEGLRPLMGKRTIEDAKVYADQRKKKVNEELTALNAKLEERSEDTEQTTGISLEDAQKAVVFAGAEVDKAQAAIDDFQSGDKSDFIEQLSNLNNDLLKAQTDFQEKKRLAQTKESQRLNDISNVKDDFDNELQNLSEHKEKLDALRADYSRIKARTPDSHPCKHHSEACPYFGLDVPEDFKKRADEQFNRNKSKDLEDNISRGKDVAAEIVLIEKSISEFEAKKKELEAVEAPSILKSEENTEIHKLKGDIEELKLAMEEDKKETPPALLEALQSAKEKQTKAQETVAEVKARSGSQTRIEDLKAEKVKLSAELDKISLFLSKFELYNKALAEQTEGPVNELFKPVKFRMFQTQENGTIIPACDVMDSENRPYNGALSNGEQIKAGETIVRVFQKFHDVDCTVWFDNAEALTSPIELDCQVVELRASDEFETLTKEV
jgi:DNA repair exonuclease SbcCD ATPase subunit